MVAVDTGLRQSMRFAAAALLTTYEHDAIVGLEIARDDYLAGFAGMLLLTAKQLQTELPKLRDIPLVSNYKEGRSHARLAVRGRAETMFAPIRRVSIG